MWWKVNPESGNLSPSSSLVKGGEWVRRSLLDSLILIAFPLWMKKVPHVALSTSLLQEFSVSTPPPKHIHHLTYLDFNTVISNWEFQQVSCNLLSCVDFLIGGYVNSNVLGVLTWNWHGWNMQSKPHQFAPIRWQSILFNGSDFLQIMMKASCLEI